MSKHVKLTIISVYYFNELLYSALVGKINKYTQCTVNHIQSIHAVLLVVTGRRFSDSAAKASDGLRRRASALGHTRVTSVREVAARLRRLVSPCPLSVSFLTFSLTVWYVQIASVLYVRYQ